jgi:hypothetical protein
VRRDRFLGKVAGAGPGLRSRLFGEGGRVAGVGRFMFFDSIRGHPTGLIRAS